jgi:hypothetical protein
MWVNLAYDTHRRFNLMSFRQFNSSNRPLDGELKLFMVILTLYSFIYPIERRSRHL